MEGFGIFVFGGDPYRCVPDKWVIGWLTGPDNDMICVKRTKDRDLSWRWTSPVSTSKLLAMVGFFLKRILICIDPIEC